MFKIIKREEMAQGTVILMDRALVFYIKRTSDTPDLKLNPWGYIVADEKTGKTSKKGVWAGGDIVTGAATVILAMGAGRDAAHAMHDDLTLGW